MLDLKTGIADAKAAYAAFVARCEATWGQVPPDVKEPVETAFSALEAHAEQAATTEVNKLAGPLFGPELTAAFKVVLDDYKAKKAIEIQGVEAALAGAAQ